MARARFRRGIRSPALTFLTPRHERAFHPGANGRSGLLPSGHGPLRLRCAKSFPQRRRVARFCPFLRRGFFCLPPPPDDAFSVSPRAAHHSAASLLCRPRQTGHCAAAARRASLPDHVCTANTIPPAPLFSTLRPQALPCRRPCFRVQHRLKSFPCAFWTCSFFRQHPASAWGARLLRLPREKLGLSFPALDIFESRLYKDFQI